MQLHIGALRNNSSRMFAKIGVDIGFDGMNDFGFAPQARHGGLMIISEA